MADLIVNDSDFECINDKYTEIGAYFEEVIEDYIALIDDICIDGIKSGHIHDNLLIYRNTAAKLNGQIEDVMGIVSGICSKFVTDIDAADEDLY